MSLGPWIRSHRPDFSLPTAVSIHVGHRGWLYGTSVSWIKLTLLNLSPGIGSWRIMCGANPTHFAVARKYDQLKMAVPILQAKE